MDGVILGMPGPWAESNYEAADIYTTKIGGVPDWPSPVAKPKPDHLECSGCRSHLSLLAQVYAPVLSKSLSIDERVIYIFGCMVVNCENPMWRAFRVQKVSSNKVMELPEPTPSSSRKNWLEDLCSFDDGEEDDDIDLEELGRAFSEASITSAPNNVTKYVKKSPQGGQLTRSIDSSIPVLPCFYIYTQEEKLLKKATSGSSELQTAMKEYEKNDEDDSNGESYEEEKYEYDSSLHADRTYLKFKKRMDAYPEQCFRYSYDGKPLVASGKMTSPDPCNFCGGTRYFEMQLMPTLIYFLQEGADDQQKMSLEKLDWLTMFVYTCSANCEGATVRVKSGDDEWIGAEESVIIQKE